MAIKYFLSLIKMRLRLIMFGLLLFLGCSKENKFLKKHDVILVTKFIQESEILTDNAKAFEENHRIKFQEANNIYKNILSKNEKNYAVIKDTFNSYPTLIIDEYYVYSFRNLKIDKVALFGIGVNANTGKQKNFTEEIWVYEKDIVK